MKKIFTLFLTFVFCLGLFLPFTAVQETQAQAIENFKKGVYIGDWIPSLETEQDVLDMAECGIQYAFIWFFSWDDPHKVQVLEWCTKYGVKAFLLDDHIYGLKMETMTEEEIYEIIKPSIGNPNILGYCILDEPPVEQFSRLEVCLNKFKAVANGMIPFINIYGYKYGHYINGVFSQLEQDFISMDAYPMINERIVDEWYNGVRAVGDAARANNADMWIFLQSMGWPGADRDPQLNDMRWQFYAAAAFGATKFTHFCYSNPAYHTTQDSAFKDSIAAVTNGVKTPKYDILQQFDSEVEFLAPRLSQYQSLGAYYVSAEGIDMPSYMETFTQNAQTDFRAIESVCSDQYLIIGGFEGRTDPLKRAFIVHNASNSYYDIEANVSFTLRYSSDPVTVTSDGRTFEVAPDGNGVYHLHLGSGSGAFVEMRERARTEQEQQIDNLYFDCCSLLNYYCDICLDSDTYEESTTTLLCAAYEKYCAELRSGQASLELLNTAFSELSAAAAQVRTVKDVTLELAQNVLDTYDQVAPELFAEKGYLSLSRYIDRLRQVLLEDASNFVLIRGYALAADADKFLVFTGLSGDLTRDGSVTLADVIRAAKHVLNGGADYTQMRIGDMDGDFELGLNDVISISKIVLNAEI